MKKRSRRFSRDDTQQKKKIVMTNDKKKDYFLVPETELIAKTQ